MEEYDIVKIKTKYGLIDISNSVIATVVGGAATSNYGVVEWLSKATQYGMSLVILNRELSTRCSN